MARPKEYDRETVLSEAMNVFWGTGYFGTNMNQLIKATRLNPGSLYGAFGSKDALFFAALDHYGKMSIESVQSMLYCHDSPVESIRAWIRMVASEVTDKDNHGCFLVNTAIELSGRSHEIQERVNTYLEGIGRMLATRLEDARGVGEISNDKDPEAVASFILCTIWGLRVLGETSPSEAKVVAISNQLIALLGK